MIEIGYDFAGRLVLISAPERAQLAGFDAILRRLETTRTKDPHCRINVHVTEAVALPDGVSIVHRGPALNEPDAIYAVESIRRYLLLPEKACLVFDPGSAKVDLTVQFDQIGCISGLCGIHAIDAALEATDQLLLHAAALTLPDRSAGILLYAASGTGKTTTTLRLAFDGFGVFSDDAAVVGASVRGHELWGLPRFLKIHRNTAVLDPKFASLATGDWDHNDEQVVNLDEIAAAGVRVERAFPVPLAALVCLTRNAETMKAPTSVRPMARADALCVLTEDNVRTSSQGVLKFQEARMKLIAGLVRDVATYECRIGPDFASVSRAMLAAITKT